MPLSVEKEKFVLVAKRILKEKLSTEPATLLTYKTDIIEAYCTFVKYCQKKLTLNLSNTDKQTIHDTQNYIIEKFEACLIKLNCKYSLSANLLDLPNSDEIKIFGIEIEESNEESFYSEHYITLGELPNNNPIMSTITEPELLKLAANTINKPYSGEPLDLDSFIDSIELLKTLATTVQLTPLLTAFIKTKISGRAREFLTTEDTTIAQIVARLKQKIKPDSSKIIEGRMLSLHLSNSNQEEFIKKTEELAEGLRRSLVIEGMSATKASEISVEKTVELCRKNTTSDLIKSVLESTSFESSKEVVAKLIIQNDKVRTEAQNKPSGSQHVLSIRAQNRNKPFNQTSYPKRNNYNYNNFNRNHQNARYFNNQNWRNNNSFNRSNRGNHSSYGQNRQNFYRSNNRSRNVRYMSGNEQPPAQAQLPQRQAQEENYNREEI